MSEIVKEELRLVCGYVVQYIHGKLGYSRKLIPVILEITQKIPGVVLRASVHIPSLAVCLWNVCNYMQHTFS